MFKFHMHDMSCVKARTHRDAGVAPSRPCAKHASLTKHAGHAMQTPLLEMRDMTWHVNVAKVAIHPKMILFAFFQKRRLF